MKKWIESTGKTEDAAIQKALSQLGLDRDEVEVEILARAKSGFLGIGSQPAKVKVTYEAPEEETPVAPAAAVTVEEKKVEAPVERTAPVKAPTPKAEKPAAPKAEPLPVEAGSCEERIVTFLTGLLAQMDSSAQAQIVSTEGDSYQVELVGEGLGQLIGRRGETLDAIQQLTNYAVNHGQTHRVRIHLDAENYRAKREESLQRLAHKTAGKAIKNRRNVTLEPMNAYERHVIHAALQDYRGVTTYSIGTEPNRRIVVAYSKD
jgi:spoIIIJ-associated protein